MNSEQKKKKIGHTQTHFHSVKKPRQINLICKSSVYNIIQFIYNIIYKINTSYIK